MLGSWAVLPRPCSQTEPQIGTRFDPRLSPDLHDKSRFLEYGSNSRENSGKFGNRGVQVSLSENQVAKAGHVLIPAGDKAEQRAKVWD